MQFTCSGLGTLGQEVPVCFCCNAGRGLTALPEGFEIDVGLLTAACGHLFIDDDTFFLHPFLIGLLHLLTFLLSFW